MTQTAPRSPRHARVDEEEPTRAIPVIPAQRSETPVVAPPPAVPAPFAAFSAAPALPAADPVYDAPAGLHPVVPVPRAQRRRVLPAVLGAATAVLLVAGVAIGIGGTAGTEMTQPPPATGTP